MENVIVAPGSQAAGRLGRSVAAVLAGFATILVTHTGTDAIMHATGVFPRAGEAMTDGLFALAIGYRVVFSVLGAYLTARLAPRRPLAHALVLGGIGVVLSLAGLLATWNRGPEFGPHWYAIVLVLVSLPCCWLGARLHRSSQSI
jgi:hypothetical protein